MKLSYKSFVEGIETHHLKVDKDSLKEFERVESECERVESDSEVCEIWNRREFVREWVDTEKKKFVRKNKYYS